MHRQLQQITYAILLIYTFSAPLEAQTGSATGKVTADGEPVGFATIQIDGTASGTETDVNGEFTIDGLTAGEHVLRASYVGYNSIKKTITIQPGEVASVDFALEGSALIDEIVVTGTMKPTYLLESPIKVEVVSSKQLETYLPPGSSTVMEAIQLVNGVQEVVACGVCFTNSISINGLDGAYTAVLMDGMPIYGNLASVYGLNGIPGMIIDRIEVIKGPSSTLYGSEAVAGVINIITKDPSEQSALSVDIMGTTHRELFGNLALAPRIGKSHGFIGVNYARMDDFEDWNEDGFNDGLNLDRYSFFTKWNIHRESGKAFNLAGKYYYEDRRNGVYEFLDDRAYRSLRGDDKIYGESIYTDRVELFGTYEFNTTPYLKLDFSLSRHLQDSYYGSDHYTASQNIAFGNFIWNGQKGRHDILAGATLRYQMYDDNTVATEYVDTDSSIVNAPDNQFIPGIFIQDELKFNNKWTLLTGVRFDHYVRHGLIVAPRVNVKYRPTEWTTIRANFGTGFRVVNLFTEDHAFITGQRSVEITESLNPERSYNGSLSTNIIYTLGNGTGSIDIEGYYTYFTNKIIPDYSEPGKIIYANSEGHAQTMGIGTNISYGFSFPLRLSGGINFQRAVQSEMNEEGIRETTDIEFAPKWTGIVTANYTFEKIRTTFAYSAKFTGSMALPEVFDLDENGQPLPDSRPTSSRPFAFHNIQLTGKINDTWSLYTGIANLFDYRQPYSPLTGYNDPNNYPGFSDLFDTSYAYSPTHGREFYLGIKMNLGVR